jgi:beta-1,4-mannosyltransferase
VRIIAWPAFRNRHRNPYNWLLYTHLRDYGVEAHDYQDVEVPTADYSILHLHWPDARLKAGSARTALKQLISQHRLIGRARRAGIRIVWTVHNLGSHERAHPWLERLFWRTFLPRVDAYISLSEAGRAAALARHPRLARVPGFVIPHGHYRDAYPNSVGREEARARLGIPPSAIVLTFIGLIRSYKNVPRLLAAFRGLRDPDALLLVPGQVVWPEREETIRAAASSDPRIRLRPGFVPDDEIQLYLNAADLVVLPFREILNSGSALLALSFDRPVLVPAEGSIVELQATVGDEWVRTYQGVLSTDHLADAVQWVRRRTDPGRAPLDDRSWSEVARQTAEAYRQVRGA